MSFRVQHKLRRKGGFADSFQSSVPVQGLLACRLDTNNILKSTHTNGVLGVPGAMHVVPRRQRRRLCYILLSHTADAGSCSPLHNGRAWPTPHELSILFRYVEMMVAFILLHAERKGELVDHPPGDPNVNVAHGGSRNSKTGDGGGPACMTPERT
jgi:hypothetical protein